jgi:hypothetical protein
MASSGKKKTTMAKLARENKLRERRLDKQTKREARKASAEHLDSPEGAPNATTAGGALDATQERSPAGEAERAVKAEASAKDFSLRRLRDAPDEELALFEGRLRQDALAAGATEQELREAQAGHPGHG